MIVSFEVESEEAKEVCSASPFGTYSYLGHPQCAAVILPVLLVDARGRVGHCHDEEKKGDVRRRNKRQSIAGCVRQYDNAQFGHVESFIVRGQATSMLLVISVKIFVVENVVSKGFRNRVGARRCSHGR
jgi:hypothetical protein